MLSYHYPKSYLKLYTLSFFEKTWEISTHSDKYDSHRVIKKRFFVFNKKTDFNRNKNHCLRNKYNCIINKQYCVSFVIKMGFDTFEEGYILERIGLK